jgi:hypothetical protein
MRRSAAGVGSKSDVDAAALSQRSFLEQILPEWNLL